MDPHTSANLGSVGQANLPIKRKTKRRRNCGEIPMVLGSLRPRTWGFQTPPFCCTGPGKDQRQGSWQVEGEVWRRFEETFCVWTRREDGHEGSPYQHISACLKVYVVLATPPFGVPKTSWKRCNLKVSGIQPDHSRWQWPIEELKLQRDLKPQLELKTLISDKTFSSKFGWYAWCREIRRKPLGMTVIHGRFTNISQYQLSKLVCRILSIKSIKWYILHTAWWSFNVSWEGWTEIRWIRGNPDAKEVNAERWRMRVSKTCVEPFPGPLKIDKTFERWGWQVCFVSFWMFLGYFQGLWLYRGWASTVTCATKGAWTHGSSEDFNQIPWSTIKHHEVPCKNEIHHWTIWPCKMM